MNAKKTTIGFGISAIALIAISFYGGMKYSQAEGARDGNFTRFRGGGDAGGMAQGGRFGGGGGPGGLRGLSGMNFSAGEIIAKDATSLTVKLPDGGSKIVFYSDSTEVGTFVSGALSDLEVGATITASGTANSDGSVTAQTIQMRPAPGAQVK